MSAHPHLALVSADQDRSPRPGRPIRVMLADDHVAVRRTLRLLLDGEPDMEVIAEAADLRAVMHDIHAQLPRVLVLGLELPKRDGGEAIRRLRDHVPESEIVVLTMAVSPPFAQLAFEAGAAGFVLKDRADSELPAAVRNAALGNEYVSPQLAARLDALRLADGGDSLSPRQTEILRLIALGHTNTEIATQMHVSRRAIEAQRGHICRKLRIATRAELVGYALCRHLIGG